MNALLIGTTLAVVALLFVLQPLWRGAIPTPRRTGNPRTGAALPAEDPIAALREIEFDRATGKLSDDDYATLKARYTRSALANLRADDAAAARPAEDEVEALVLRYRRASACGSCGPRPEPDAVFCSGCGRYLAGSCASCGAPAGEPGGRFCTNCGHSLAA